MSGFSLDSDSTPQSFIDVLATDRSSLNWERFLFLYGPLFERWLRQHAIPPSDAQDLIQDSLLVVIRRLPDFKHNGRTGAFRAWLKQILAYQVAQHLGKIRSVSQCDWESPELAIPSPNSNLDDLWDQEHDREILRRLLQLTRPLVPAKWWDAFYRTAIVGDDSSLVAKELSMSLNGVYIARSRVLGQLRRLGRGLVESTDGEASSEKSE